MAEELFTIPFAVTTPSATNALVSVSPNPGYVITPSRLGVRCASAQDITVKRVTALTGGTALVAGRGRIGSQTGFTSAREHSNAGTVLETCQVLAQLSTFGVYELGRYPEVRRYRPGWGITLLGIPVDDAAIAIAGKTFKFRASPPADAPPIYYVAAGSGKGYSAQNLAQKIRVSVPTALGVHWDDERKPDTVTVFEDFASLTKITIPTKAGDTGSLIVIAALPTFSLALYSSGTAATSGFLEVAQINETEALYELQQA
jgi:hypothetical protein